ncbi:hypothetical protein C8J57DRAFT_975199, partial [Mycena rebaudengoi]
DDPVLISRTPEGLQRHLDTLSSWCSDNFLSVNSSKSAAMVFGPISANPNLRLSVCFRLGGDDIPLVAERKYVGVRFTSVKRDIFRSHYEHKQKTASYVFWRIVLGCNLYVGRGRLPPIVGCQLYYAPIDCHLTHASGMIIHVDPVSFALVEDLNLTILRKILGLGARSGIPQLYLQLGVYPLHMRRLELAVRYLTYLLGPPHQHLAYKALLEADRLRSNG